MDLEQEISIALSYESTKESWRNDHSSDEFKLVKQVGFTIGSPITNEKGCRCIERFFMLAHAYSRDNEKINLKKEQMESEFKVLKGKLITFGGSHYTVANMTDSVAVRMLTTNPAHIASFESYPSNWKELCGGKAELTPRQTELINLELADLFAIAQELVDADDNLRMPGARSREAKLVSFIIDNESI